MVVIITIIVLVFTGRYLLRLGHEISVEVLKNVIQVETAGNYQIDFEEVTLNIRDKKLALSGLTLVPIIPKSEFNKTIYEVDIDSVVIHLESLSSIYLERELAIDSVRIIDPAVSLANPDQSTDSLNFSLQTGNLYHIITDQLAVLSIGKFHVENGDLSHSPSNFQLAGFHLEMDGLLMDSVRQRNRVFFSTDITLEINDQVMLLPDSIHEVGFEKFLLSTKDSVLRFQNAYLRPSSVSGYSFLGDNDLNIYDIQVPILSLDGLDYFKTYNENVLSIDRVSIESPIVRVDNEEKTADTSVDNNLFELLTDVFDSLQVKEFLLTDANVDLKLNSGGSNQRLVSNRTDIAIYGLLLDSINAVLDEGNRYFDSASFKLLDYTYNLPDSIHQLNVRALTLNSSDSSIIVEDLRLAPDRNPNSSKTLAYLDIPYSSLTGVSFKEAILGERLRLKDYFIAEPSLRILPDLKKKVDRNNKTNFTPADLFEIISIRYEEFYSRSFEVYDAQIQIEDKGLIRDINFTLSQIGLNRKTELWTDMINQMEIGSGRIQWYLDSLNVTTGGIQISNKGTDVALDGLQIRDPSDSIVFKTDQVYLSGHRPNKLVSGQFHTDTLTLVKPILSWRLDREDPKDSVGGTREKLSIEIPDQIGYLKIEDGTVDLLRDSVKLASTTGVHLWMSSDENQPLDQLISDKVIVEMNGTSVNKFEIEKVEYSRTSRNLVLYQVFLDGGESAFLKTDQITLSGIYQKGLFKDQYLLAASCKLQGVESSIDLGGFSNEMKNSATEFNVSLGHLAIENQLSSVKLLNGQKIYWKNGGLLIDEFSNLSGNLLANYAFLLGKSGAFSGDLDILSDKQQFFLQGVKLDHKAKAFEVDTLVMENVKNMEVAIYQLEIGGYSPDAFLNENRLQVGYVSSKGSAVTFQRAKDEVSVQVLSLPFNELIIDSLKLYNNQWKLLDQFKGTITSLNDLNLQSLSFSLDSLSDLNRWFDFSQQLSISGSEFSQPLGDDYQFTIKDYAFDLAENQVKLLKVSVDPKLDRYAFSAKQKTQKSWFDVDIDQITVEKIDWGAMANGRYIIDKVKVDQVTAEIYRDKNNPFTEDQYSPMPQKTLQDLDVPMWIDTIDITANIKYIERPINSDQEGVMTFDDVQGYLYDFRTEDTLTDQQMVFATQGKLFDSAPFNVNVSFDQKGPNYPYRMQGSVSDFDLVTLNQMLGPVAGVNIRSGYGEKIEFDFLADAKVASGDMRFRYDDLKIDILNKKTHEAHGLGRGIKTFFANTFVVKKKNSGFAFFVKKGQIFYERDTSRAIFNYWGKALISGAVSSIGINKSDKAAKRYQKSLAKSLKADD